MLWCGDLSDISLATNPILYARTKHVELHIHFLRKKVLLYEFLVHCIPAIEQSIDILTKPLAIQPFLGIHTKLRAIQLSLSLRGDDKVFIHESCASTRKW